MERKLNHYYSGSMGLFFALFSSMFTFVSVFLLHRGFDNTTIGTILSLTSILSIGLQTVLANYLDKKPNVRIQNVLSIYAIIIFLLSILLYFTKVPLMIPLLILIIFAIAQSSESLLNAMAFIFERFGIYINFGVARGIGSFAFAATTLFLGYITEKFTPDLIPLFYALFSLGLIFVMQKYKHPKEEETDMQVTADDTPDAYEDPSLAAFFVRNKKLVFLMIGIAFLLFTHILINNFFIQIITPIGGNNVMMGTAIFLGAMLELPGMFNYDKLEQRIPTHQLLKIAGVFFFIKHTLTYLAPNMLVIYIAQVFQIGAYGLVIPAGVSYVRSAVSQRDMLKGQSLFTNAMALSSVVGSFLGGFLLDNYGADLTLFIGIIASLIGVVIVFLATEKQTKPTQKNQ